MELLVLVEKLVFMIWRRVTQVSSILGEETSTPTHGCSPGRKIDGISQIPVKYEYFSRFLVTISKTVKTETQEFPSFPAPG